MTDQHDAPNGESFAQRVAELERVIQTNHPTINNEIILDLLQCVRAQQAALRAALNESGCDGDLCMHDWHERHRAVLAKWRIEP